MTSASTTSTSTAPAKTFSRRLFLTYQELIKGKTTGLDDVVEQFAAKNSGVDLEQKLTFAEWYAESGNAPKLTSLK